MAAVVEPGDGIILALRPTGLVSEGETMQAPKEMLAGHVRILGATDGITEHIVVKGGGK